ncbi:MAG: DUF4160 domain-containing protein [Gluconacetobacter diazotrophicus]|nr:DUF4160 domain-containing protein [Gluconacetobacter diazotrophicus]
MVTVLRADELRVVIYLNDHLPAHVHVFGDGEVKIDPSGRGAAVDLVWGDRASRSEVRRAMRLVAGNRSMLLQRWEDIHGRAE